MMEKAFQCSVMGIMIASLFSPQVSLVRAAESDGLNPTFLLEMSRFWPEHENIQGLVHANDQGNEMVTYEVRFVADWSMVNHPTQFPPNPHFSGLIGGSHHVDTSFWEPGGMATPGIQNMAETGSKFPLQSEVQTAINEGRAGALLSGGPIGLSPGQVTMTFDLTRAFPRVSLVTMIAPSPDWFVGVHGVSLFRDGEWQQEVTVELLPYDAGTDSGPDYLSPDQPTVPHEPIFAINGNPFLNMGSLRSLGRFVFTRQ